MYKIISTAITKKVYKKIQTKHYKLKKKNKNGIIINAQLTHMESGKGK